MQAGPHGGSEGKCARAGQEGKPSQGRAQPGLVVHSLPSRYSAAPRSTPLHVARLAEETIVQGVAALVRGLNRQEDPAVLTPIAIFMEVSSHALDFEGIFPIPRNDGIFTDAADGGEFPVEVIQAVHLVLAAQGKALIPNAPGAGHTREAGGVEGLAQGPDDVVLDHFATLAALLQRVLVAGFAEGSPILLVEALSSQLAAAVAACKALGMVLPFHGLHSQLSGGHGLVAEGTDVCGRLFLSRFCWGRWQLFLYGPEGTGLD